MRGGMDSNPFAGNPSMASLDNVFMEAFFTGELTLDQTIALRIIKMSVKDYLYFGLGKNGITPTKYLDAYDYLFKCRSDDPRTWFNQDTTQRYRDVGGKLQTHKSETLPKEISLKCFDTHYNTSRLAESIPLSNFLARLKKKREMIINANIKQVLAHIQSYRNEEWKGLPRTERKGKYSFPRVGVVSTLVSPADSKSLAMLFLYGRTPPDKKQPQVEKEILPTLLNYKKTLFPEGVQ